MAASTEQVVPQADAAPPSDSWTASAGPKMTSTVKQSQKVALPTREAGGLTSGCPALAATEPQCGARLPLERSRRVNDRVETKTAQSARRSHQGPSSEWISTELMPHLRLHGLRPIQPRQSHPTTPTEPVSEPVAATETAVPNRDSESQRREPERDHSQHLYRLTPQRRMRRKKRTQRSQAREERQEPMSERQQAADRAMPR